MPLPIKSFSGEIPRLPADRLPDGGAQAATNCDFAHGELRSLKGLGAHFLAASAARPVRGLFTDDGLRFFCWNKPTRAHLHPTFDDTLGRVIYQTHGEGVRVAQVATMKLFGMQPGPPSESWKLGVAPPAGILSAAVEASEYWAGDPGARVFISALCKVGDAVVRETPLTTIEEITKWSTYSVTVPDAAMPSSTGSSTPVAPGGDGYLVVPEACITHQPAINQYTVGEEGGAIPLIVGGARAWAANGLKLRADGRANRVGGTIFDEFNPTAIDYLGKIYMPATALYAALTGGTAANYASGTAETLAFRVSIQNPGAGVVYYEQETLGVAGGATSGGQTFTVSISPQASASGETRETVVYVAVAVNLFGEESAPGPPVMVEKTAGQQVRLSITHSGDPDQVPLRGMLFYRTYASRQSADYYLLTPMPVAESGGVFTLVDTTTTINNTAVLQSAEWDPPPDGAGNLTYAGNGSFCVSSGKDLVFSEPYKPHAWPYRMSFPHGIVGVIEVERGVLVTTQAQTWIVNGAHPTQMSQQLLPAEQSGWSDTSLARVAGAAVFASNDGLVSVFGGQPSLAESQQLFTREDWRKKYADTRQNLRLAAHDGYVLGIVDPGYPLTLPAQAFLLRLDEAAGSLCHIDLGQPLYCAVACGATDKLYCGTVNGFAEFAGGSETSKTWRSKIHVFPRPASFAAVTADCDGTLTIEFIADGVSIHTEYVSGYKPFRLPPHAPARRWAVQATGTGTLRALDLGASFAELQGV